MLFRTARAAARLASRRQPALTTKFTARSFAARASSGLFQPSTIAHAADDGGHPDFAPQRKVPESADANTANTFIDKCVKENDVFLFMKGTPEAPQCGFSNQVCQILKHTGASFSSANVLEDELIRNGIKVYSDWPTIPQLYIKGEFVGGCDIVTQMFQDGELQEALGLDGGDDA